MSYANIEDNPYIVCDGCGKKRLVLARSRDAPYKWFIDDESPPRWSGENQEYEDRRTDYCEKCSRERL